jgi:hypothetical protein
MEAAKRGDLVVVESVHTDFVIGKGCNSHPEFVVAVVTNITRECLIKAVRPVGYSHTVELTRMVGFRKAHLVPKARIDVDAALKAAAEHTWTGKPGDTPKYFDTLDAARDVLRPHLIETLAVKR